MIKVAKFGGTSLADEIQFNKVKQIIFNDKSIKYIVASAPGICMKYNNKITDLLYKCYYIHNDNDNDSSVDLFKVIVERYSELVEDLNICIDINSILKNIYDNLLNGCSLEYFVSRGEYVNGIILAKYLNYKFIDAIDIIHFTNNKLNTKLTDKKIKEVLKGKEYIVIPGFYGISDMEGIKTFTRGGSDITGSLISKAVDADIYENWTDVSGIFMVDPRIVKNPRKINTITYRELRELAYMGATVMHDEAVFPVRDVNIPINIRNTNDIKDCGTFIVDKIDALDDRNTLTGISGKKDYTIFTITKENMASSVGVIKEALSIFNKRNIAVEHVPTGIDRFSVVVSTNKVINELNKIKRELKNNCCADNVKVYSNLALIASVGRNMVKKSSVLKKIFKALEKENIDIKMICQGLSDINIIIGVDNKDFVKCISAIYSEFK